MVDILSTHIMTLIRLCRNSRSVQRDVLNDILSNYTLIAFLVLSVIISPVLIISALLLKQDIEKNKTKSNIRLYCSQEGNKGAPPNPPKRLPTRRSLQYLQPDCMCTPYHQVPGPKDCHNSAILPLAILKRSKPTTLVGLSLAGIPKNSFFGVSSHCP